jgi:hypothetical protein
MADHNRARAMLFEKLKRRQRLAQPEVVGDSALSIERHVDACANQNPNPAKISAIAKRMDR